jgi:hypothetical protein
MHPLSPIGTNASLKSFRRGDLEAVQERELPAVFVLEPHMWRTAAVVAAWGPAALVQMMDATSTSSPSVALAQVERAMSELGAASIVLCAEGSTSPAHGRGALRLLELRSAMAEDPVLGARLRANPFPIEALWFDLGEGDVHRWDPESRSFRLLSDQGLERLLANLRAAAARRLEPGST